MNQNERALLTQTAKAVIKLAERMRSGGSFKEQQADLAVMVKRGDGPAHYDCRTDGDSNGVAGGKVVGVVGGVLEGSAAGES